MSNHHSDEQLRAFLANYLAEIRPAVVEMRQAQANNDMEKLRDFGQQVMGSSSYIAAGALHKLAAQLVDAIDLDEGNIIDLATRTADEMEAVVNEISGLNLSGKASANEGEATPLSKPADENSGKKSCCEMM